MDMAIYRNIHVSFWSDPKVTDDFTPEEKYFFLYVMTNPHTNLLGCYEISKKQMSDETGYTKDVIEKLLARMQDTHGVLEYSDFSKEMYIINWHKYNWTGSEKQHKAILSQLSAIKDPVFKSYLTDTISIRYPYPMDTTDTDTDTNINTSSDSKDPISKDIKEIIDYLNTVCNTKYKSNVEKTRTLIRARLSEKFTIDDFKTVIDKKNQEWGNDGKMSKYLRPETLFGTKFEAYLNQKSVLSTATGTDISGWAKR